MTTQTLIGIQEWLEDYETAFFETAESSLDIQNSQRICVENDHPRENVAGAYMPLICGEEEVIIGLITDQVTFQSLAKKFVQADDSETLSKEDTADSVKEIVNVVAGVLKSQMASKKTGIKLGLPFFLEGHIKLTEAQEAIYSKICLGSWEAFLMIIRTRPRILDLTISEPETDIVHRTSQEWLSEALTAAFMLTITNLGLEKYQVQRIVHTFPNNDIAGAYMPLIGDDDAVLIGLLSDTAGLESIARAFLQLPAEEALDWSMTVDSIKEVLNVLSGMVKTQLFKQKTNFKINLPFFVDGYIEVTDKQEAAAALIEMGNAQTYLVIIKRKN